MRTKINLNQAHFAYVDDSLLKAFRAYSQVVNLSKFIKKSFYDDFGFIIKSNEDNPTVDEIVKANFYQDKSEWLREKMRDEIRKQGCVRNANR